MSTELPRLLSPDSLRQVSDGLQDTLVELIDLALQGKQAHWNVTGMNFRALHLQLDEMIAEYRTWSDLVAERVVALGLPPDGRAATVAQAEAFEPFASGFISDEQVLAAFTDRLTVFVQRARQRMDEMAESDPVSQDILIQVVGGAEKQLWMLRAYKPVVQTPMTDKDRALARGVA
jgi:starvation-inducible DNA-binding protein